MDMATNTNPFNAPVPAEVHLPQAPLIRVIAQIRFPEILEIGERDAVSRFQRSIRSTYPILRQTQTHGFQLGAEGFQQVKPKVAWRFSDKDDKWKVGLSSDFLALDTTAYVNRADFIARLVDLTKALEEAFNPGQIDRFGMRYVDRLNEDALGDLCNLVRPEVCGIVGSDIFENVAQTFHESLLTLGEDQMVARWGMLPQNSTFDPDVVEPLNRKSWILDVDMFTSKTIPFSAEKVSGLASHYADNIYKFFRWAVKPAFLTRFGGKL